MAFFARPHAGFQRSDMIHEMIYLDQSSLDLEKRRDNGAQIVSWRYMLFTLASLLIKP